MDSCVPDIVDIHRRLGTRNEKAQTLKNNANLYHFKAVGTIIAVEDAPITFLTCLKQPTFQGTCA
jgi:hypothetical protein